MEVNKICEENVSLGDLVFIIHKENNLYIRKTHT